MQTLTMKSNYSVQCSMLRSHTFFNLDLRNEITGQELISVFVFVPLTLQEIMNSRVEWSDLSISIIN